MNHGPHDSYWVHDGLLAGPYPGAMDDSEARAKLGDLLDAGVDHFIDLTEAGEGPPLEPYEPLLRQLPGEQGRDAGYVRMPIRDVDVPKAEEMRAILDVIAEANEQNRTVYVHCWGGVGRTGTVVGCHLIEQCVPPEEALERIAEMRVGLQRAPRVSPETEAQRAMVRNWRRP